MKIRLLCLVLAFLLLFSACRWLEPTGEEIESRLSKIAGTIPSAAAEDVVVSGSGQARSAFVTLTWTEEQGRFSTEKSLEKYSRDFAAAAAKKAPMIASLSLEWMVPFHSEEEAVMKFSFTRQEGGLVQNGVEDRFTDGTFGADAYIDPNAAVEIPVRRYEPPEPSEEETPDVGTLPESAAGEPVPEARESAPEASAGEPTPEASAENTEASE